MTLNELFGAIADAIREKDGSTGAIKASKFPERILAISTSGGGGGAEKEIPTFSVSPSLPSQINVNQSFVATVTTNSDGQIYAYIGNPSTGMVGSITARAVEVEVILNQISGQGKRLGTSEVTIGVLETENYQGVSETFTVMVVSGDIA